MQKLIVIVGPTSSGKTKLAVDLARKFNGEIVSADSRQVYRGMDIGTGKDPSEYGPHPALSRGERETKKNPPPLVGGVRGGGNGQGEGVPYHLIDVVSPRTTFTLARYQTLAYKAIEDILRRGKVPILVGGTGLYVQAVVDGYVLPKAPPNPVLRARLAKLSLPALRAKLKNLDLATYRAIDKNNRRRLERAIEVCVGTGIPLSQQRVKYPTPYEILMLGLGPRIIKVRSHFNDTPVAPWAVLYRRIDRRLRERLKQGMVDEVKRLHKQGISWKRLESFGLEYRYVSRYLRSIVRAEILKRAKSYDRTTWSEIKNREHKRMVRELSQAIKDFARRQMTWFKRDKRIVWIKNKKEAERLVGEFLAM